MAKKKEPTPLETAIVRARQRALYAWNQQWTQQQIRKGVDGPVPKGRKEPSDYNQHVPLMESSAAAQNVYFDRANAIMKMGAAELGINEEDYAEKE